MNSSSSCAGGVGQQRLQLEQLGDAQVAAVRELAALLAEPRAPGLHGGEAYPRPMARIKWAPMGADPLDFLGLDPLLSDEERMIRDAVRQFVADRVLPGIEGWFERGEFPPRSSPELGKLGLLGMHLQGYGCAGANAVSYGLTCLEMEAGDSGFRSAVSVQGSLSMFPIWKFGSEEQKQEWLPRMASGEVIGCFGLTEPDVGSDPSEMRTAARRDGTRLGALRDEDVDHQRRHRRRRDRLGADRRRHPRVLSCRPTPEASGPEHRAQALAARVKTLTE